jgi:hypothetical protein
VLPLRRQRTVFVVATNRLRALDAAVTRPGRFDLILLAGPPALADRLSRLDAKLVAAGLDRATQPELDAAVGTLGDAPAPAIARRLLQEAWEDEGGAGGEVLLLTACSSCTRNISLDERYPCSECLAFRSGADTDDSYIQSIAFVVSRLSHPCRACAAGAVPDVC